MRITAPVVDSHYVPLLKPASLWRVAAGVVKRCVDDNGRRTGGYSTLGFDNVVEYINDPSRDDPDTRLRNPFRKCASI